MVLFTDTWPGSACSPKGTDPLKAAGAVCGGGAVWVVGGGE